MGVNLGPLWSLHLVAPFGYSQSHQGFEILRLSEMWTDWLPWQHSYKFSFGNEFSRWSFLGFFLQPMGIAFPKT